jgi:hypothetical protein
MDEDEVHAAASEPSDPNKGPAAQPEGDPRGDGSSGDARLAAAGADPWVRRCELVALLLVLAVAGIALAAGLHAIRLRQVTDTEFVTGTAVDSGQLAAPWSYVLGVLAYLGGSLTNGVALALALALVALSPGDRIGRLGTRVLNALSVLGVVVGACAMIGVEEIIRIKNESGPTTFLNDPATSGAARVLDKATGILQVLPAATLAFGVAWVAWRMLNEVPTVELPPDRAPRRDAGAHGVEPDDPPAS